MKNPLILLGATATLFLACNVDWSDLSMPEQVKVATTPGLYLPLTKNLFSGEFEKYSPEKLINDKLSPGKVKEMIGNNMSGITVSAYRDPSDPDAALTYLLRYPLAEMPYDLSQYMASLEIEAPSISLNVGNGISAPPPGTPLPSPIPFPSVNVDIRDMANLVSSLTYTEFGIKIAGNFERGMEVHITDSNAPANGGFDLTSTGVYKSDGYTHFVKSNGTWKPSKSYASLIIIDMTLTHYPNAPVDSSGNITIQPEFILDWTEVIVNPGDIEKLEGELPLDFSGLGQTLNGITFPAGSVEAYLYTSGLPQSTAAITLKSITITPSSVMHTLVDQAPLRESNAPELPSDGSPYMEPIPPSSLTDPPPLGAIDLTDTLNSSLSGEVKLSYIVEMGQITLNNGDRNGAISAVLLIKLPLALQYSGGAFNSSGAVYKNVSDPSTPVANGDYFTFGMDGLDFSTMFDDDTDLLEPIKGDFEGDGVSGGLALKTVSLVLANCDATLLQNVCIAIKQNKGARTGVLIELSTYTPGDDIPVEFDVDMDKPFAPSIDILLKKEPSGSATLSLKESGKFRFGLIVEIESELDVTVDL